VAAVEATARPPEVLPALATGVPAPEIAAALRSFAKQKHVLIVGHEPQLSAVASIVLTGSPGGANLELKKGGCVALHVPSRPDKGGAQLLWLLTPRQLRTLRK